MSTAALYAPAMEWTGERMIPESADLATKLYHWQRYLYFRPWYENAIVIDAACGEGYGTSYAAAFAQRAYGFDISRDAVRHALRRYPNARFRVEDVCEVDYSQADVVTSFETIEHLPDPVKFLQALSACKGRVVISTPNRNHHSPGNKLEDKPYNEFHTIEWTPAEFAELINQHFPGREVRFLSQQLRWPGSLTPGFDPDAAYCIAVIGEGELPKWPKIGISIPTVNNWPLLQEAIVSMSQFYPGELRFAIVANGCDEATLTPMREMAGSMPHVMHVIEETKNHGFGVGCNLGLAFLQEEGGYDYYGVSNDDVIPHADCICEMVYAMEQLIEAGHKPGVVGPVSNNINGMQFVNLGAMTDYASMIRLADAHHHKHQGAVTLVQQLRGLFMLIHPDCLESVGGFDPRFGIGNFEDDDYNLRCTLSGFSTWIAQGSFLYHHGSSTFRNLEVDYVENIRTNGELMRQKWNVPSVEQWIYVKERPEGVNLHVPLKAK